MAGDQILGLGPILRCIPFPDEPGFELDPAFFQAVACAQKIVIPFSRYQADKGDNRFPDPAQFQSLGHCHHAIVHDVDTALAQIMAVLRRRGGRRRHYFVHEPADPEAIENGPESAVGGGLMKG
jgi:hypothetical protein